MALRQALVILAAAACAASAAPEPLMHLRIPMRDGVSLCGNLWLPAMAGRYPVALTRTPYRKLEKLTPALRQFLDAGFAVLVQDVRGRGHSEGKFRQFLQESGDAEDTLNWIIRQPWSDGSVGMFGGSYPGIAAWRAALSNHPALKALSVAFAGGDEYLDRYYSPGGAFKLGHRLWWIAENFNLQGHARPPFVEVVQHLPLITAGQRATGQTIDFLQAALENPSYTEYWKSLSTQLQAGRVSSPAHITAGWFDNYGPSDIEMFRTLRAAGRPARLLIGPWGHNPSVPVDGVEIEHSRYPIRRSEVDWFAGWIRRSKAAPPSGVTYFVMGLNRWRQAANWPPEGATLADLFLSSGGNANSSNGDGVLAGRPPKQPKADQFTYDPRRPVPTVGGSPCCNSRNMMWGPLDQREVEARADVLVYTGPKLEAPVEIAGAVQTVLWVKSSARDTDFTAKLVDVAPDGTARLVCNGILRLRYRDGLDRPKVYLPGSVVRITIAAGAAAWQFAIGHRIRLEVSSSNFPLFDRNPNTGRGVAGETQLKAARQTVLHGRAHPSRLVLPVWSAARIAGAGNGSIP